MSQSVSERRPSCGGRFHILRTERLIMRSPTWRDTMAAFAGAADDDAQRWLGWTADSIAPPPVRSQMLATPPEGGERPEQPTQNNGRLVAIDPEQQRIAGLASLVAMPGGVQVGGWLAPDFRGRGLGAELFAGAAEYAHRHLQFPLLRAGIEDGNVACHKALAAAGFVPADGPPTFRLENGREIRSRWFEHVDGTPGRCPAEGRIEAPVQRGDPD